MFFRKKKKEPTVPYDPERQRPILRCSICTGEQAAGFQDLRTGEFREVMLIRNEKDLQEFMDLYNLDHVEKVY